MSDIAIRVEGLGKQYRIGGKQEPYRTLRDTITDAVAAPFRRANRLLRGQAYGAAGLEETIWALKDVSFEVKRGEVVGIIGRNGAGKSTLLKVLSRITEPTEGYAEVYGRVGSLLEVGTGFHPELTGRENIYLNGAILGMKRAEIDRKFDEIVAFAEVERFIDTPVKHYSSGMYLRLAFAVAAHLDPEILLVDEVLAVGDAQFQKKCLGKMGEVAGEGRTVLFVSHNMGVISALCSHAIWLQAGRMRRLGQVDELVTSYIKDDLLSNRKNAFFAGHRSGTGQVQYTSIKLVNHEGLETSEFLMGKAMKIICELVAKEDLQFVRTSIVIKTTTGVPVLHFIDQDDDFEILGVQAGEVVQFQVELPELILYPGSYVVSLWAGDFAQRDFDYVHDCAVFQVHQAPIFGRTLPMSWERGIVYQFSHWSKIRTNGSGTK